MSVKTLNETSIKSDISIVVPIRNLERWRVKNLLSSIRQNVETEVILSDYGSNEESLSQVKELSIEYNATLLHVTTDDLWSRGRASNMGIRRSGGKWIAVIDGDSILEPSVISDTKHILEDRKMRVIRQPIFLSEALEYNTLLFPESYKTLRDNGGKYIGPSLGAFIIAPRVDWFLLRGFDERLQVWGCDDWELRNRFINTGLKDIIIGGMDAPDGRYGIVAPNENCNVYHQWHVDPQIRLGVSKEVFDYNRKMNGEYFNEGGVVRNNENWGLMNSV